MKMFSCFVKRAVTLASDYPVAALSHVSGQLSLSKFLNAEAKERTMKPGSDKYGQAIGRAVGGLLVGALLAIGLASAAWANTIYTYTGKPFTTIQGDYSCVNGVGVCQITGYFTLPQVPISLGFAEINPSSWEFTDGVNVFNETNTIDRGDSIFEIETDGLGRITRWRILLRVGFVPYRLLGIKNDPLDRGMGIGDGSNHANDTAGSVALGVAYNTEAGSWSSWPDLTDLFQQLIDTVAGFNLRQGIANSLDAKLSNAQKAFEKAGPGDTASACGMLGAFINEVQAQSGKALTVAQATTLIGRASLVRTALGCQ
jgi:hypothetical protein